MHTSVDKTESKEEEKRMKSNADFVLNDYLWNEGSSTEFVESTNRD